MVCHRVMILVNVLSVFVFCHIFSNLFFNLNEKSRKYPEKNVSEFCFSLKDYSGVLAQLKI